MPYSFSLRFIILYDTMWTYIFWGYGEYDFKNIHC